VSVSAGCGFEPPPTLTKATVRPHLIALSTYEASVGAVIDAYGSGFPQGGEASTSIIFRGRFTSEGGTSSPVDLEVDARAVDGSTLRWTTFGPYTNPFSPSGASIGVFQGTAAARLKLKDGSIVGDSAPVDVRFKVLPSILVREFQPTTASCNGQVKRGLGGASYQVRVEAVGFEPVSFTYNLAYPSAGARPITLRHIAGGPYDQMGQRGDFQLPPVPEGSQSYGAVLTVQARDRHSAMHQNAFAITVHRPLEVYYYGNVEVAEVLAPVPVSGCIPGGEAGRDVEYNESMEETRSRQYELNWNQSWLSSHTVSSGRMQTIGLSETNGVGFSTTDGRNWNWSLGTEVEGTFGISELVSVGVKVNGSVGGGGSQSVENSASRQRGIDQSSTTTETTEINMQQGGQKGGSFNWQVSSSQTISRQFGGHVIAKTYGVFYRQALRLLRRAAVVTYNQCGAANVIADVDFHDWSWSPDLALGQSCPPLPASNLPSKACLVPPCD
jgi:hypothetical protein